MAEDSVSLTALTKAELRRIIDDERYRELIKELLPRDSDLESGEESSEGYQETPTSGLSDSKSQPSVGKKDHSSQRSKRKRRHRASSSSEGPSSGRVDRSNRDESSKKAREADHLSSNKAGGADHSPSNRKGKGADHSLSREDKRVDQSLRRSDRSSNKKDVRGRADHSSSSRKGRVADHSQPRESNRLAVSRSYLSAESSESEPVRRKRRAEPLEHPVKRPRLSDRKRKTAQRLRVPPSKRTCTTDAHSSSSESDSEDDESEGFNPTLEQEDKDEFRMDVPRPVGKYVNRHFRKGLTKEERTAMLKKHPKPNATAARLPKLDQFVVDFAGKKLDKAREAQLCRIQTNVLYVANPLTCLWSQLIDQGLTQRQDAKIGVSNVINTIQRTLVLLGNANNFISETRREWALEAIHPTLKKYGKGDFTEAEEHLFGETFKETLVKKVEADSVLSKAVNIVTRSSKGRDVHYQKTTSRYGRRGRFFGNRASGYGAAPGRAYNPYNAHSSQLYSGKGKQTTGRPYFKKGVFNRLGPQNPSRTHQRPNQDHNN